MKIKARINHQIFCELRLFIDLSDVFKRVGQDRNLNVPIQRPIFASNQFKSIRNPNQYETPVALAHSNSLLCTLVKRYEAEATFVTPKKPMSKRNDHALIA